MSKITMRSWEVHDKGLDAFLQEAVDLGWNIISVSPYKLYGAQSQTTEYYTSVRQWKVVGSKERKSEVKS